MSHSQFVNYQFIILAISYHHYYFHFEVIDFDQFFDFNCLIHRFLVEQWVINLNFIILTYHCF